MATPMTADQRIAAYRRWGVPFREKTGWRTHNRTGPGRPWGPVHGIMIHHTGDDAPDTADERVLWEGRSDLPGPLCHDGQRDDGTVVLMSAGRANHAGPGSARVLEAMIEDRTIPAPGPDDYPDGNRHFYGRETMYSGKNPPTGPAYRSTVLACAAVCEFHGWNPMTSIIGHREWTRRKIDPGSLNMDALRRDVTAELRLGPPALRPRAATTSKKGNSMIQIHTPKGQFVYGGNAAPVPIGRGDLTAKMRTEIGMPVVHLSEEQVRSLTAYHVAADRALVDAVTAALTPVLQREGINPAELQAALEALEIDVPEASA